MCVENILIFSWKSYVSREGVVDMEYKIDYGSKT